MRKNILNSCFLFAVILFASACAPKKVIVVPPDPVQQDTVALRPGNQADNIAMLANKNLMFNTLSLKGKAKLDIDGEENNVNINIRIQNNEMIWVSVSAIIGEVARIAITPDSIRIINRLQTTYTRKPFSYIHEFTSEKIDFSVLQAILSGNLISKLINPEVTAEQENGVWVLQGKDAELSYRFLFNTLLRLQETNLNNVTAGQALKVTYGNYQELNGALVPASLVINSMAGTKKINIELEFSNIEGNVALDFPFSVKPRFKVIN